MRYVSTKNEEQLLGKTLPCSPQDGSPQQMETEQAAGQ